MDLPKRKPLRLKNYNYSQNGCYFITACVQNMENRLCCTIQNSPDETHPRRGEQCSPAEVPHFALSDIGKILDVAIMDIPKYYLNTTVDKYVIMPNHFHMIIKLQSKSSGETLSTINTTMKQLKGYVTKQIGFSIWQKSFYEHVIRKESEYLEIWQYIDNNPLKWELDKYYNDNF